jgi:WD40 repeat protein
VEGGHRKRSAHTHWPHSGCLFRGVQPRRPLLASGSADWSETIKLWEVATGREVRTLKGHTWGVNSVAFSLDGKLLASGSADGTIKLWNISDLLGR